MNKEYAIYPFRFMNITQRHDEGNHLSHWNNAIDYSDKPWDEALADAGRSYFEPQNDFIIEQVLGLNTTTTNSVRLKSVNKLYIPYKSDPEYLYVTLTHMNEDNLAQVKEGQVLKKGTKILLEGTDGFATGNHFHITANIGKYYGLLQNNNGKWCYTYEKSLLPNEAFYLDNNYTNVIYNGGYKFESVPKPENIGEIVSRDENLNQIEVIVNDLYCRLTPELNGQILGYARQGIHNYTDSKIADGYTWYYIKSGWIAYNDNWCILYPVNNKQKEDEDIDNNKENDKDSDNPRENDKKDNFIKRFIKVIMKFFKKIFNR